MFEGRCAGVGPGDRYRFLLDGRGPFPDPASRFQPDGVHGASMVVDSTSFAWSDHGWRGVSMEDLVLYELHVGTFTPRGTFAGVEARLPYLRDLGATAIELMPVADFPGSHNWGYDGAALFAPARCYGTPDDLRRLVDSAHGIGLAVLLDVVYNHVGPDGAYLQVFSPYYFTDRHKSPWGAGIDLDGEHSAHVRELVVENALHWVHEYHVDGLRLDATHAIQDESPRHVLAELTSRVKASAPDRQVLLIAEDHRNLARMVTPASRDGWGLDGVWADDLHHQVRRLVAGDSDGYYRDFRGTTDDVASTIRHGWFFTGQYATYFGEPRGTDPTGIPLERFVVYLQNHDQVGNRAFGERLHHVIDLASYRAASVLLMMVPETPLLFMGQEWAATAPFLYFTDHHAELGRQVSEGRRREFERFTAFSEPSVRERIPDPQAEATFAASRLDWTEQSRQPHAGTLELYRALIAMRRREAALRRTGRERAVAVALDDGTVAVGRSSASETVIVVSRLTGSGSVDLGGVPVLPSDRTDLHWTSLLCSEEPRFAADPDPPVVTWSDRGPTIRFARPSALILKAILADRGSGLLWGQPD
jgi:maltooligosyltrehalose trehalohydrolase